LTDRLINPGGSILLAVLAAAYKAKKEENVKNGIELGRKVGNESQKYPQKQFWDFKLSGERNSLKSIQIERDQFDILRSKERISLPGGVCIYCKAMDETLGEMRIHYAGFVHPFFGFKRTDERKGTPLIFEVRGHNVPVLLTHGEILARLFIYRMSENVNEEKYDEQLKRSVGAKTNYNDQELKLSNLFQEHWSE
jgi:dCTP deaminase